MPKDCEYKFPYMDAEIDPEADEQHREGDRDQVEMTDRERREPGRPHQPDDQRYQHGHDKAKRSKPRDQDQADEHDGDQPQYPHA